MAKRSRIFTIATFGSMAAVFAGMINLVTIRDTSIMIVIVGVLIVLSVMAIRERTKIRKDQQSSKNPSKQSGN